MLVRLCHVCGVLNESEQGEILKCEGCSKTFLPMNYFESLKKKVQQAGGTADISVTFAFNPLPGLIVFW